MSKSRQALFLSFLKLTSEEDKVFRQLKNLTLFYI